MKRLLLSLIALVSLSASAQTYYWQEDFSSFAKDSVPTGGDYKYVSVNGESKTKIYNENLAGGKSPELLVGKSGGSFAATIA